jgi:hypothetical protein
MVANHQLFAGIFILCQNYGLAVHPHPIFRIRHSFIFPYQRILYPLSEYYWKCQTYLENLFDSSILEDLSGLFCRPDFDRWHKLPLPNPMGR